MKNLALLAGTAFVSLLAAASALAADADSFRSIAVEEAVADPEFSATLVGVELSADSSIADGVLYDGDKIAFDLKGVTDASIYILNLDMAGEVRVIFPNEFDKGNEPGETTDLLIPTAEAEKPYHFTVNVPEGATLPGTEIVKIIVARGDYSALEDMIYEYFDKQEAFPKAIAPVEDIAEAFSEFAIEHGETQFIEATIELEIR